MKQIFEEGCRQYLQSIGMIGDVASEDALDQIAGIGPTVAAGQAIVRQSDPRSMVGARTKILTYLGLLYAREGQMPCSICGTIVGGGDGMVCMGCGNIETPLQANASSFNSPSGMCLQCGGRGVDLEPHLERLVLDKRITPRGVLETVDASSALQYLCKGKLRPYADLPFVELPDDARTHTLYGLKIRGTSHLLRARPGPRRRHRLQADRSVA